MKLYCPLGHFPTKGIAQASIWDNENPNAQEIYHVIVDAAGNSTNHYEDGTVGVTQEHQDEAERDEEPRCFNHPTELCSWKY